MEGAEDAGAGTSPGILVEGCQVRKGVADRVGED